MMTVVVLVLVLVVSTTIMHQSSTILNTEKQNRFLHYHSTEIDYCCGEVLTSLLSIKKVKAI